MMRENETRNHLGLVLAVILAVILWNRGKPPLP